jgi:TRAP-type C4-dicarboxylate transport system permease small subunit
MKIEAVQKAYSAVNRLNSFCASLSGILLLFITFSIFIDVIMRYFFNKPSIWITEVSTYLFLYIIFLGTAYAFQMDLHIRVTFLVDRFGYPLQRWFEFSTSILALFFCTVLLWQTTTMTWQAFHEKWTTPTVLSVHYALIYISMVIGSALLLLTIFLKSLLQVMAPRKSAMRPEG